MTDGKSVFRVGGMTDRILVWEMRVLTTLLVVGLTGLVRK